MPVLSGKAKRVTELSLKMPLTILPEILKLGPIMKNTPLICLFASLAILEFLPLSFLTAADETGSPPALAGDLHGGLIVQLGAGDLGPSEELSHTGRYLVHLLDTKQDAVQAAQKELQSKARYGLTWAEALPATDRLPYAENVVNRIQALEFAPPASELYRVLTPGGQLWISKSAGLSPKALSDAGFAEVKESGPGISATKPWPTAMDDWSHPRHDAGGNAVSGDTAVGPPDRVRWVAAATQEVEGLVTAGGRNFYGGILARDSFNGLRLWHRDLARKEPAEGDFQLPRLPANLARPIASGELVLAVLADGLVALNAATGEIAVQYPGMEHPVEVAREGDFVLASNETTLKAYDFHTGKEVWSLDAAEPRNVIAGGDIVNFIYGRPKRGEKAETKTVDIHTGKTMWDRSDFDWLDNVTRSVLYRDQIAFEVSSFNNDSEGNAIHLLSAKDGQFAWEKAFPPGMNHVRQARAMFVEDDLWILHGGKIDNPDDPKKPAREPIEVSSLDPKTGEVRETYPAGLAHCFPPVATPSYMFAGVLDLTDLDTGEILANRITKANCSRENGWVPANGLVYTTPKHCTCWPMLRGFVGMAPAMVGENPAHRPVDEIDFKLETGPAQLPDSPAAGNADWPSYRRDAWRSGSTPIPGPKKLTTLWSAPLIPEKEVQARMESPSSPILYDWRENPFVKGPLTAPIVVKGTAYVSRPDAHEVIAVKADGSGEVLWRFTTDGRVDTAPTYHRGLLLFGTHTGSVYALRADSGERVWRLNAAPTEERIVAYGQVESPWPVAGSILVDNDIAYFAAGRQELADGGVLIFAVDPMTGKKHWIHRIDTVPQEGFYENSGLEFDPVDLLHRDGNHIAMSRWLISLDGKESSVDKWNAFARLDPDGEGAVWMPRGYWTYGARHQHRFPGEAPRRPLCAYRGGNIVGTLDGTTDIFMREFPKNDLEAFDKKWITGWAAAGAARDGDKPYRNYRIAEKAQWTVDPFTPEGVQKEEPKKGTQLHNEVFGLVLAGDDTIFALHKDGRIRSIRPSDGSVIAEGSVEQPVWDSLVLADNKLFLTTMQGNLVCVGD